MLAAELSPDCTHLAYVGGVGGPAAPARRGHGRGHAAARLVLDQSAAAVVGAGHLTGLVWSADGQWLFWVTDDGTLRAWHVGDEQPITVDGAGHIPALKAIGLAR